MTQMDFRYNNFLRVLCAFARGQNYFISRQGAKNAKDDPVIIYQKTGSIFSLRSLRLCES
jgi:hypothetical protein